MSVFEDIDGTIQMEAVSNLLEGLCLFDWAGGSAHNMQ